VLGNAQVYAVYSGIFFPERFLRQVGSKLLYFSPTDSAEHTLLDFAASLGDTVSKRHSEPFWIVLMGKSTNASLQQQQWQFAFGNGSVVNGAWSIVDSLGLFGVAMEPGVSWTLAGARIDGKVRYGNISSVANSGIATPSTTVLYPNYPNPFNPSTRIQFYLAEHSYVSLTVFDILGRHISTIYQGPLSPGFHSYVWHAVNCSTGIYFCRLQSGNFMGVSKLIFSK